MDTSDRSNSRDILKSPVLRITLSYLSPKRVLYQRDEVSYADPIYAPLQLGPPYAEYIVDHFGRLAPTLYRPLAWFWKGLYVDQGELQHTSPWNQRTSYQRLSTQGIYDRF